MTDMLINLFIRSFPKFSKPFPEKTEHACGKEQVTDGFKFTHKGARLSGFVNLTIWPTFVMKNKCIIP